MFDKHEKEYPYTPVPSEETKTLFGLISPQWKIQESDSLGKNQQEVIIGKWLLFLDRVNKGLMIAREAVQGRISGDLKSIEAYSLAHDALLCDDETFPGELGKVRKGFETLLSGKPCDDEIQQLTRTFAINIADNLDRAQMSYSLTQIGGYRDAPFS